MIKIKKIAFIFLVGGLTACGASGDHPGTEFAPNMYHSVPYDPLKQITDEREGKIVSSRDDDLGEFYNSNPHNPFNMTMRVPPANTVKRREDGALPYRIHSDSLELAARTLVNPFEATEEVLRGGQVLYNIHCVPCHGGAGHGDGPVAEKYMGVPLFNAGRVSELTEGHVYHVITYGINRMAAYGPQIDVVDRWKIVKYVQQLQQQPGN
jgi:mono/diheme cytochrome c family protein